MLTPQCQDGTFEKSFQSTGIFHQLSFVQELIDDTHPFHTADRVKIWSALLSFLMSEKLRTNRTCFSETTTLDARPAERLGRTSVY